MDQPRLFLKNILATSTPSQLEDDLRQIGAGQGLLEARIQRQGALRPGQLVSAFVRYETHDDVKDAIKAAHGRFLPLSSTVRVWAEVARPRTKTPARPPVRRGDASNASRPSKPSRPTSPPSAPAASAPLGPPPTRPTPEPSRDPAGPPKRITLTPVPEHVRKERAAKGETVPGLKGKSIQDANRAAREELAQAEQRAIEAKEAMLKARKRVEAAEAEALGKVATTAAPSSAAEPSNAAEPSTAAGPTARPSSAAAPTPEPEAPTMPKMPGAVLTPAGLVHPQPSALCDSQVLERQINYMNNEYNEFI